MWRLALSKQAVRVVANKQIVARSITIGQANTKHGVAPLIERYRPSWPDADFEGVNGDTLPPLPPRTVPDELFQFEYRTSTEKGTARFYEHLTVNPADIKVKATFSLKDMPLNDQEKKIFVSLLGPRYNVGNQRFKLVCEKFQHRIENCKYIIYLLETLLADSRRLAKEYCGSSKPSKA